jgi:hypothetical protein
LEDIEYTIDVWVLRNKSNLDLAKEILNLLNAVLDGKEGDKWKLKLYVAIYAEKNTAWM